MVNLHWKEVCHGDGHGSTGLAFAEVLDGGEIAQGRGERKAHASEEKLEKIYRAVAKLGYRASLGD